MERNFPCVSNGARDWEKNESDATMVEDRLWKLLETTTQTLE